jgi:A/G-specific adenine glycosylase
MRSFAAALIDWHTAHGRHDLPWQATRDPYAIWVSEIMLQQTQVATVIPYYRRFIDRFPDIKRLAVAPLEAVLKLWSGLGYYSRARNLHRAAQTVMHEHGGRFPTAYERVVALPGIGRSTAAAICAFAFGERRAILDGNVKRVLTRHFAVEGFPGNSDVETVLWRHAEALLPAENIGTYTQALMDLGARICTRRKPRCAACPVAIGCLARIKGLAHALPTPRPRKALPHRKTVMLVLEHEGQVLLERRPESGIWGGLWSLPEASDEELQTLCLARYGAHVDGAHALVEVEHGFTHFSLTIDPRLVCVTRLQPRVAEHNQMWMPIDVAIGAAIPAPVRRILLGLQERRAQ